MAALRSLGGDAAVGLGLHRRRAASPRWSSGSGWPPDLGRPAGRGRLHQPAGDPRGQPAAAGDRARPGRGRAGAGAVGAAPRTRWCSRSTGSRPCWAYLGDPDRLGEVIAELEPRLRAPRRHLAAAVGRVRVVVRARRRGPTGTTPGPWSPRRWSSTALSGYPAYAGYLHAHDGWFARLAGDLDDARRVGREAVEATSPVDHPWWYATAAGLLAATLIETGDAGRGRGRRPARAGHRRAGDGRRAGCAAWPRWPPLTGDPALVAEARERALDAVECPPGQAWVAGADVYLLLGAARAAASRGHRRLAGAVRWLPRRSRCRAQISSSTS